MSKNIGLSLPNLDNEIVDMLKECIETGWVSTGGRFITEFEESFAKYVGMEKAVSIQSGTGGLHVALDVLGVKPGDEIIVPTLTFIATVNPIKYVGAEPVFMDCDDTMNMDLDKLESFLSNECEIKGEELYNKSTGNRIPVITVVHVFGNPIDMERVMDLASKYKLQVLEDAAEALGSFYTEGRYKGKHCGTIGKMGVFSFNANKIITTGGGGMVVSNDDDLLEHLRFLSVQAKTDSLYFIHDEIGYNYRMTNLQAALGCSQLGKIEEFVEKKIHMYNRYCDELKEVKGIKVVPFNSGTRANHWFFSLVVDKEGYGIDRDELLQKLIADGIQTRPLWRLIHKNKPYISSKSYDIEKAIHFESNILNVPCSTNLSDEDLSYVIDKIKSHKK